jgi:hypothetical protein
VRGMVACVSYNETVCRGRERGTLYWQYDGSSQQLMFGLNTRTARLTAVHHDTRPWYCTSAPLCVLSSTLESYTGKNICIQFFPRVLILASAIYSILPSSGWSTESQQIRLSYLIESFHAQKNSKK